MSKYTNPAHVEVDRRCYICTGRICSGTPRCMVSKSLKSTNQRTVSFNFTCEGVCQMMSRLWETVSRGMSQHSHLLLVNALVCLGTTLQEMVQVTINFTNLTKLVQVDWPLSWMGRIWLTSCDFIFSNAEINPRWTTSISYARCVSINQLISSIWENKSHRTLPPNSHLLFLGNGSHFAGQPWDRAT